MAFPLPELPDELPEEDDELASSAMRGVESGTEVVAAGTTGGVESCEEGGGVVVPAIGDDLRRPVVCNRASLG